MKITAVGYGSRGDVQPVIVLAHHLASLGHDVTIAVPANDVAIARRLLHDVVALPFDGPAVLKEGNLLRSLRAGRNVAFFSEGMRLDEKRRVETAHALFLACEGADVLLASPLAEDVMLCIAEAKRQRVGLVMPMPMWSNSFYPSFFFATRRLPGWLTRLTFWLTELGARKVIAPINELRATLGLGPVTRRPAVIFREHRPPVLYWVPERILPRPPELGDNHHFTGYWPVPAAVRQALGEAARPSGLAAFLESGAPPVFVGFGSMPVLDDDLRVMLDEVATRLGRRIVLGMGWSTQAGESTERVFVVDKADHEWLLPRCAAAVHHGGASTTGAALRAGIPQVVASVFADQPFWGRRVRELGVGEHLRFQKLTAARLHGALTRVLAPEVVARAQALGAELAAQPDGGEVAARLVDARGETFPIPGPMP